MKKNNIQNKLAKIDFDMVIIEKRNEWKSWLKNVADVCTEDWKPAPNLTWNQMVLIHTSDVGVGDVCFFLTMRCFNDVMFSNS